MINGVFLIKRRETGGEGPPAALSAGQFAFNKVDETLYIGTGNNTPIPIAGAGAFVSKSSIQTLSSSWQEAYSNLVANSAAYINIFPLDAGYF